LDGWGKLSAKNLENSINETKKISLDRFIFALGIRHIGQENAKILAKYFKSINNFKKLAESREQIFNSLLDLDGIGETQISSLKNFFSKKINKKIF
jgi:DNA ligase (NAD+)